MMTSVSDASATTWDPVAIIKEYASNPSVKIRRNAATALAALSARHDAVRSLLDMALDPDNAQSDLSAHIFKELLTLDDRERQTVLAHLYAAIDDKNQPQRQSAAYIALARLRAFGVRLHPASRRWRARLAVARVGAWTAQAQKARRPTFTCTFFMVVAGFVVSLLFMMYLYTRMPTILAGEGVFPILIAIIAMLATSKALVSVLGSVPAYLHIDRVASGVRDIAMAALCVASLSSMLTPILMTMMRFSGNTWDWVKAVLLASATLGVVTAVVRAATLFATYAPERLLALGDERHGRSSRRFVERRANRRRIFQIAAGTAIGGLTAYLLGPLMRIGYTNLWPADFTRMVEGTLQFALMAAPSIAVAFAFLDYPTGILEWLPGGQRQNSHWARSPGTVVREPSDTHRYGGAIRQIQLVVCLGSAAFVVAITLWIIVKLLMIQPVTLRAASGVEREQRYWVASTPAAVSFDVPFLQSFAANLQGGAPASLALYTWNGETPSDDASEDMPPLNCTVKQQRRAVRPRAQQIPSFQLGRGCYEVEVLPALTEGTGLRQSLRTLIDGWLLARYKTVPNSGNNDEGRLQLHLRLNPFKNTGRVERQATPMEQPSTLSRSGAISWIAHNAPAQRTIEVKERMAFFASVDARQFNPDEIKRGPDGLPLDPDDPAASTDRAYDLLDQGLFNRIPPRRLFKLELTSEDKTVPIRDVRTAGDGILSLRRDLDPGRYVLTFKPPAEGKQFPPNWFAINAALAPAATGSFLPADRVLLSRERPAVVTDRLTGAWKIERLPMTVNFTLHERRHVVATIPENTVIDPFTRSTVTSPDYTLQLASKGKEITVSDNDPEVITWTLEPGDYSLLVFGVRNPPAAGAWLMIDVRPPTGEESNTPAPLGRP
jgi:hypothetical protein